MYRLYGMKIFISIHPNPEEISETHLQMEGQYSIR